MIAKSAFSKAKKPFLIEDDGHYSLISLEGIPGKN